MQEHVCVQLIAANKLHTQNKKKHMNFYVKNTSKDKEQSNRKKEELAWIWSKRPNIESWRMQE